MPADCPKCNGTGFELRTVDGGVTTAVRCECLDQGRSERLFGAARIPRRYADCRFDSFDLWDDDKSQARAKKHLEHHLLKKKNLRRSRRSLRQR